MPRKTGHYNLKGDYERTGGYAGDGLSVFTHAAAHNRYRANVHDSARAPRKPTLLRDMIEEQELKLKKLRAKLLRADHSADRLAKICSDIQAKGQFLARLKAEL